MVKVKPYSFSLWNFKLNINLDLFHRKKENMDPKLYRDYLKDILNSYHNCDLFYTDASKMEKGISIVIVHPYDTIKSKLPN